MPVSHWLKQIQGERGDRKNRDIRPDWLVELVDGLAERFDPDTDVARAGYCCHPLETGWDVDLFLGRTEVVGGPHDGKEMPTPFRFDLSVFQQAFTKIVSMNWNTGGAEGGSRVTVEGLICEHAVRVTVHSLPPQEIGPGLRALPGGETVPV